MKSEINLLPKELQVKRARKAYLRGFGRLLKRIYLLLLLLVIAEGLILWAVVTLRSQLVADQAAREGLNVTEQVLQVNTTLQEFEERLESFTSWTLLLEDVLAIAPDGIRLTTVSGETEADALVLEGVSLSRSSVVTFQEELEALSWVVSVEAPLQNFALGPEITFSFSLHRSEQEEEL